MGRPNDGALLRLLHVLQGAGAAMNPPYSMEQMQCYLKYARAIKPRITQQVRRSAIHRALSRRTQAMPRQAPC